MHAVARIAGRRWVRLPRPAARPATPTPRGGRGVPAEAHNVMRGILCENEQDGGWWRARGRPVCGIVRLYADETLYLVWAVMGEILTTPDRPRQAEGSYAFFATALCHSRIRTKQRGAATRYFVYKAPFARHRRGTFRVAFVVEDWPVRVRTSQGSRWTCPVSATGRHRMRHSAPRSRSWRKKSSSSCISCSGWKSSSRRGGGVSSPVAS
jgi:hypothetical protein